jgi:DnaJ-class molecular chaperone
MAREPLIPMKMPCEVCNGTGSVPLGPPPTGGQWMPGSQGQTCSTCGGYGLVPRDVPLSVFRALLAG